MEIDIEQKYKDFLSTISHELRTPLTSIRGFADTILMSFDKLTDEQKIKFITIIKEQSNRLIDLVENILSVSKIDDVNVSNFVFKPIYPENILKTAISILKTKYQDYDFKIDNFAKDCQIYADEGKLQQVFINLLENSAKYSPENKEINITLKIKNNKFIISVRDFGVGIDAENFEKIFEKFSRVDTPLTRKTEGSGLGLYITKNLIEKMNGKIMPLLVDKGACFEIVFDICSAQTPLENKI